MTACATWTRWRTYASVCLSRVWTSSRSSADRTGPQLPPPVATEPGPHSPVWRQRALPASIAHSVPRCVMWLVVSSLTGRHPPVLKIASPRNRAWPCHGFSTAALGSMDDACARPGRGDGSRRSLHACSKSTRAAHRRGAVHGAKVARVESTSTCRGVDALVTDRAASPCSRPMPTATRYVLWDPEHRCAALAHAGWRGKRWRGWARRRLRSAEMIRLQSRHRSERASDPASAAVCYEWGEVASQFDRRSSTAATEIASCRPGGGESGRARDGRRGRRSTSSGCAPKRRTLPSHRRNPDGTRFGGIVLSGERRRQPCFGSRAHRSRRRDPGEITIVAVPRSVGGLPHALDAGLTILGRTGSTQGWRRWRRSRRHLASDRPPADEQVRIAVEHFALIQSVDSGKAGRGDRACPRGASVLVEVKRRPGAAEIRPPAPTRTLEAITAIAACSTCQGLMAMGPSHGDPTPY